MNEDVLTEILKRLPAKDLCRFQSVSKYFKSLISSSLFINLHRSFSYSATPYQLKPYLKQPRRSSDPLFKYNTPPIDLLRPIAGQQSIEPLRIPFLPRKDSVTFIDCIRGVICLSYSNTQEVILWNPTIHKYLIIPPLDLDAKLGGIGFGYDSNHDDFKVIWIDKLLVCRELHYRIYLFGRRCWSPELIAYVDAGDELSNNYIDRRKKRSCFVNGTIHWIVDVNGKRGKFQRLLMFDCACEEWRSVEIEMTLRKLVEYNGMLGALVTKGRKEHIEMWVMDNDGNVWNKLFKFSFSLYEYKYHIYEETMCLMDHPGILTPYSEQGIAVFKGESEIRMRGGYRIVLGRLVEYGGMLGGLARNIMWVMDGVENVWNKFSLKFALSM